MHVLPPVPFVMMYDFLGMEAVAGRLARHRAGLRMQVSSTSPETMAAAIVANLGKEVSYEPIPSSEARLAARRTLECADRSRQGRGESSPGPAGHL